ncbi:unnamed protein product [Auanema sp. JU1783]|nr:unnamed protein product [Auanema sp. JU1783]
MTDRICGCNVITAAGIVTSLQLILLVLTLAPTGMVLDRYRIWEATEERGTLNQTEADLYAAEGKTLKFKPTRWSKSCLEFIMGWYVGYGAFWLFTLLILTLSFKYYRPVFVIPNFTALVFGFFMNLLAFGVTLWRILDSSKSYRTDEYEESFLCYVMGILLIASLCCLIFIIFIHKYHSFLRLRYGHQVPKFVQTRSRMGYPDDVY